MNDMATRIRRLTLIYGKDDLKALPPDAPHREGPAMLSFHRAPREESHAPSDVVALLRAAGITTGTLRARNPIMHEQWWIPVTALAVAASPYAKALASVAKVWLKERRGRLVRLENGRSKVTANSAADAERLLAALTRHEKELGLLQVSKARQPATKKAAAKRINKKS